jgi:hypothetical protein
LTELLGKYFVDQAWWNSLIPHAALFQFFLEHVDGFLVSQGRAGTASSGGAAVQHFKRVVTSLLAHEGDPQAPNRLPPNPQLMEEATKAAVWAKEWYEGQGDPGVVPAAAAAAASATAAPATTEATAGVHAPSSSPSSNNNHLPPSLCKCGRSSSPWTWHLHSSFHWQPLQHSNGLSLFPCRCGCNSPRSWRRLPQCRRLNPRKRSSPSSWHLQPPQWRRQRHNSSSSSSPLPLPPCGSPWTWRRLPRPPRHLNPAKCSSPLRPLCRTRRSSRDKRSPARPRAKRTPNRWQAIHR